MSLGDNLGAWGLIVCLIGIGITILWPTQKWLGWLCIGVAALLIIGWAALAIKGHRTTPVESTSSLGSQAQPAIPNISPTEPDFAIRMTSLVTNGALMLWARDNNDSRVNYFCRVPILAEIYLTNNQTHWTIITRLHVEAMDGDGQWRSLGVIDTLAASPIYKGLNMYHVQPIKPVDGKYLDRQIVGKNIGPGETASGWLFLTQDLTHNIKGPFKFSLSDIHGSSYIIGPISVEDGGDNAGLPPGGFETEEGFADLSALRQEDCPKLSRL
jgi:hypothetical protein